MKDPFLAEPRKKNTYTHTHNARAPFVVCYRMYVLRAIFSHLCTVYINVENVYVSGGCSSIQRKINANKRVNINKRSR